MEKNLKIKPVHWSFKNKSAAYCLELLRYVNIETMNIISSDLEMNKVLGNNRNNF